MFELYVKKGCPYCRKQIEELTREGHEYKIYDVDGDPSALKTAKEKYGAGIVPVLVENGKVKTIGFEGEG